MTLCKKHPSEPAVGVCASCLRDRLLGLQACVTQPRSPDGAAPDSIHHQQHHDRRSSTRPASLFCAGPPPPPPPPPPPGKKAGFSVLSTLFGTPGGGPSPSGDRCSRGPSHEHAPAGGTGVPPSFSSWLAALFAVRCKRNRRPGGRVGSHTRDASSAGSSAAAASGIDTNKVDHQQTAAAALAACQRPTCRFQTYRGMSPGSEPEDEEDATGQQHPQDGEKDRAVASSPSASTTTTSPASSSFDAHPALPGPTPARTFWTRDAAAVKAGFAVCFSPLVRARPHHHGRSRVVAGDVQKLPGFRMRRHGQHNHRLRHNSGGGAGGGGGSAVKLCPNRSRKLVDMGRFR